MPIESNLHVDMSSDVFVRQLLPAWLTLLAVVGLLTLLTWHFVKRPTRFRTLVPLIAASAVIGVGSVTHRVRCELAACSFIYTYLPWVVAFDGLQLIVAIGATMKWLIGRKKTGSSSARAKHLALTSAVSTLAITTSGIATMRLWQ